MLMQRETRETTSMKSLLELEERITSMKSLLELEERITSMKSLLELEDRITSMKSLLELDEQTAPMKSSLKPDEQTTPMKSSLKSDEQTTPMKSSLKPDEQTTPMKSSLKSDEQTTPMKSSLKPDEQTTPMKSSLKLDEQMTSMESSLKLAEQTVYANDNHEELALIWYGYVGDETRFETIMVPQLRNVINYFKRYKTREKFLQFISSISTEQVFVILANCHRAELQDLLGNLHDLEQVTDIYIYSETTHVTIDDEWLEFRKLQGVFTDETQLIHHLMKDVKFVNLLSFDILKIDGDESSIRDLTKESLMFLRSKLLFDHLLSIPASERGKRDTILQFKSEYKGNQKQTDAIEVFAQTYDAKDAIWWYTSGVFIYKIVNKALRLQNMKIIFELRFFITDLYKQLSDLSSRQSNNQAPFTVYRGTNLSTKDLKKIKYNVGSLISMNSFVSTSRDKEVARIFHGHDENAILKPILFEMAIEPRFVLVPFADITASSNFQQEKEVLFSLNMIFKIETYSLDGNGIWNVKLSTSAEQNTDLNRLITLCFDSIDEMIFDTSIGNNFIKLLCYMREYDVAKTFCLTLLDGTETDHDQQVIIHSNLGYILYTKGHISTALEHYHKAYTTAQEQCKRPEKQEQTRLLLVKLCDSLANIYMKHNSYGEALKYYLESFKVEIDHTPINYETLKQRCSNIASIYSRTGKFDMALTFYSKAINYLFILSLKNVTLFMGDIYYQIANVYEHLRNKPLTLKYANLAFDTSIKALPADYINIITYEKNKKIAELSLQSNRLSETQPVMIKQDLISVYNVDDLITFEKNDHLSVEPLVVVWLKPNFVENTSLDICCTQKVFQDTNKCRKYLSSIKRQSVFLVLPGYSGEYSTETFYGYSSVVFIYISISDQVQSVAVPHHQKVRGLYVGHSQFMKTICSDIKKFYSNIISINIFNVEKASANDENISFIKYYTFIKLMTRTSDYQQSEQSSINLNNFEFTKAIVEQNIPEIHKHHQFIGNVHSVIDQLYKTTFKDYSGIPTVYYSGVISCDKLYTLEQNIGAYISINNFICAYTNKYGVVQQAFNRAIDNIYHSHYVPIVIQFNVDTRLSTEFSFAPLDKVLHSNDPGLIFSLGSIFRLDEVRQTYRRNIMYHYVTLSLTLENPSILKICNKIKLYIDYDSNRLLSFGKFLCFLNEYDKANQFFSDLLDHLQRDNIDQIVAIYGMLGDISVKNLNLYAALNYYNKAIETEFSLNQNRSVEIASIYRKIGDISLHMGKKRKSLINYFRAIDIQKKYLSLSKSELILSFINIGLYYTKYGQYEIAIDYFEKAIKCLVHQSFQRDNYLSLAYFYLGFSYHCVEKYREAIECHRTALAIYLASEMSYNKRYVHSNYYYLGVNYFRMEEYDNALECFNQVIHNEIDKPHIAMASYYIGYIHYRRANYEESLKRFRISAINMNGASLANVFNNIGSVYMNIKSNTEAIKFFNLAFDCKLEFVSKKYPSIMQYYNYIKEVKDSAKLFNEITLEIHRELDIITYLLESRNKISSTYAIIRFDPDNSVSGCRRITGLRSNDEIIQYLTNSKARTIFIITYSNLNIPLNYMEKTIYIYLLLPTNQTLIRENVRDCFNDIDQLLIQLTKDLVELKISEACDETKIESHVIPNQGDQQMLASTDDTMLTLTSSNSVQFVFFVILLFVVVFLSFSPSVVRSFLSCVQFLNFFFPFCSIVAYVSICVRLSFRSV